MPYKVIVADPSPSIQKAVQAAFPYPVFEVFPCDNGSDLIEAVLRIRPDALLLNLFLPGDGRSMARQIRMREEFKNLPIVFLKGTFEAFDVGDEETAGRTVVGKPFDSEKLALDVRDLIDGALSPPTLPEEPDFDEGLDCGETTRQRKDVPETGRDRTLTEISHNPGDLEPYIRALLRRNIAALEKDIEKRVSDRILGLMKAGSGRPSGPPAGGGRETAGPDGKI